MFISSDGRSWYFSVSLAVLLFEMLFLGIKMDSKMENFALPHILMALHTFFSFNYKMTTAYFNINVLLKKVYWKTCQWLWTIAFSHLSEWYFWKRFVDYHFYREIADSTAPASPTRLSSSIYLATIDRTYPTNWKTL